MNILTIMSDEHSYQAMANAGNIYAETPNLDRLAGISQNFTNAYTTCPVCAPARASWFTGQYVCNLGTWDNSTPYDGGVYGIASWMKKEGVPVYHIGKTHFHYEGDFGFAGLESPGFLKSPDLGCYYRDDNVRRLGAEKRFERIGIKTEPSFDDKVTDRTLSWLDNAPSSPWVLNVGLLDPHFPFYVTDGHWNHFESVIGDKLPSGVLPPFTSLNKPLESLRKYFAAELADEEITRRAFIGYYAAIKELDDHIGMILDKLEEKELMDDTVVIYTSDHGEQLGYHGMWWKCCMFEQSAHIPMIVYHPSFKAKEVKDPVSLADLFPTMCSIMGFEALSDCDGESMMGLIDDGCCDAHRDFAYSEYNAHGLSGGMYMIRWQQYKYVFYTDADPQLFDLDNDRDENHDLYPSAKDDKHIAEVLEECRKRLLSICDPYEVTARSKDFQRRMKKKLGLPEKYTLERSVGFVPHPEYRKSIIQS